MFDKIAVAISAIALVAASFSVYKVSTGASMATNGSDEAFATYLRDNPGAIIASLEEYERESREAASRDQAKRDIDLVAANKAALFEDGYSQVSGNRNGDVTVVEFLDYNCGYCKRAHGEVQALLSGDDKVRYVVKEFPILGPGSVFAARAVLASREQSDEAAYDTFSDRLMTHKGTHTEASVIKIATEVGLDAERLRADMALPEIDKMLKETLSLAEALGISGTPAFVIGDSIVRGYVPVERLQELTKLARSGNPNAAPDG